MDLELLKKFAIVVEEGSLTGAAEKLHTSQPAISRAMTLFEYRLKLTLLIRHRRGVELTADGERLYDFAKKIAPLSAHLHLGDALGLNGEGLQVGEGDIDFKRLGAILKAGCPDASFIPEIWQGHKNGGDGFWVAMERLEGTL